MYSYTDKAIENLINRLKKLPNRNFTFNLNRPRAEDNLFMTDEEKEKYQELDLVRKLGGWGEVWYGPIGSSDCKHLDILQIDFHRPYSEELMLHYQNLVDFLVNDSSEMRLFKLNGVKKGYPVIKDKITHTDLVRPALYKEFEELLTKYDKNVDDFETTSDKNYKNPLLNEMVTVIDHDPVYGPESVIVCLILPRSLSREKLYLTEKKID